MRKHPVMQMVVVGAIVTAIGIPLALSVPWFPSQASSQAHNVDTLYDVLLIASVPMFAMVLTVVLFSVWKFRMKPGEELKDGPPIHGNTRLEVVWTAGPAILILSLCTYAYTVLHKDEKSKANEITVNVVGEQFTWLFSVPQGNGQAINTYQLYVQKDQPVVFKLTSRDVIHGFWVPSWREKLDVVPGITTTVRVTPTKTGTYQLVCSQLCGNGHSLMRGTIHVLTPAAYQAWRSQQKLTAPFGPSFGGAAGAPSPTGGTSTAASTTTAPAGGTSTTTAPTPTLSAAATAGKAVFTGASGCGSCHTLAAAGTTGTVGPNLGTQLAADCKRPASVTARGSGLTKCITTAIVSPYKFIPSGFQPNIMPATFSSSLTKTQIQDLVAFLSSVAK